MKLWEYALIKKEKRDKDGHLIDRAIIVLGPQTVLAEDEKGALINAARSIPEDQMEEIDRIDVLVRPF